MPRLAKLIEYLFGKLIGNSLQMANAKVAVTLALVGSFIAVVGVGYATVDAVIAGLNFVVNADLSRAMSWMVPDNATACLGAIVSAAIARAIIDYHGSILKMFVSGS